ncbi:MAG: hypothetical protein J6C59_02775 [Muribaculaceae bacterium]|nr:hypothetical protein [Muribaculaceae bacterium]
MIANRLHAADRVLVEIYLEGKEVGSYEGSGFHNVEQAVQDAVRRSGRSVKNIEDYVFRVTDLSDRTSARYRINAGGNLKLIVEP